MLYNRNTSFCPIISKPVLYRRIIFILLINYTDWDIDDLNNMKEMLPQTYGNLFSFQTIQ